MKTKVGVVLCLLLAALSVSAQTETATGTVTFVQDSRIASHPEVLVYYGLTLQDGSTLIVQSVPTISLFEPNGKVFNFPGNQAPQYAKLVRTFPGGDWMSGNIQMLELGPVHGDIYLKLDFDVLAGPAGFKRAGSLFCGLVAPKSLAPRDIMNEGYSGKLPSPTNTFSMSCSF